MGAPKPVSYCGWAEDPLSLQPTPASGELWEVTMPFFGLGQQAPYTKLQSQPPVGLEPELLGRPSGVEATRRPVVPAPASMHGGLV